MDRRQSEPPIPQEADTGWETTAPEASDTPPPAASDLRYASAGAGVLMALAANFLFTTSDAIVKSLSTRYSVFQVIAMQVSFACIPVIIMLVRDSTFSHFKVRHPWLLAARGLTAGSGAVFGFYAFSVLPLADVYALAFCSPLIVTLASIPLLKEQVGIRRLSAVAIGFLGVLTMVQPGFVELSLGHLAAFCTAVTGAGTVLIIRRIGREEERGVMVMAVMAGLAAVSFPALILVGRIPPWEDLGLAALSGTIMAAAQFTMLGGLRRASAASVAPMQYTMLVWALVYGVLLFGDPVRTNVLVGAGIVIACSLYIMHRERVRGSHTR